MKQCKWYQVCPIKYFTDQGMLEDRWVKNYCLGDWASCKRYQAEESGIPHPDYMLPDGSFRKELKPSASGF
jgi:hypothetical protein